MRRLIMVASVFFLVIATHAQDSIHVIRSDSELRDAIGRADHRLDSLDSIEKRRDLDRNLVNIVKLSQDNESRAIKGGILRIFLGIGFLILLIVGIRRKSKQKSGIKKP